jgi:hypothetical protein
MQRRVLTSISKKQAFNYMRYNWAINKSTFDERFYNLFSANQNPQKWFAMENRMRPWNACVVHLSSRASHRNTVLDQIMETRCSVAVVALHN